jgi:hypothetical protein
MGTLQYDAAPASSPMRLGFWNVLWRVALAAFVATFAVDALLAIADRIGLVTRPATGFSSDSLLDVPFAANGAWSGVADAAAWGLAGCVATLVVLAALTIGTGVRAGGRRVFLVLLLTGPYLFHVGREATTGRTTVAWIVASLLIWRFAFYEEAWPLRRQAVVVAVVAVVLLAVVAPYGVTHPLTLDSRSSSITRVSTGSIVRPVFEFENAGLADMQVTRVRLTRPLPFALASPPAASEGFSVPGHSATLVGLKLRVRGCATGDHWPIDRLIVDYRLLGLHLSEPVLLDRPLVYRCR